MAIPDDPTFDASLALWRETYGFIRNRCETLGSDVFRTRLLGRPAYCMLGAEAAEVFYRPGRMTRRGALPKSALRLLQDEGSVATLDDGDHRHRKAMFLTLMSKERAEDLAALCAEEFRRSAKGWGARRRLRLHDEFRGILGRAVISWAGLDLFGSERKRLIDEMGAMVENAGSFGPANWLARAGRRHAEGLVRHQIDRTRAGFHQPPAESPLAVIAWHRDRRGHLLGSEICTVELLNILRPTIAIARFMAFAVQALARHPEHRDRLAEDGAFARSFVQEVRRMAPFFPFIGGFAREDFVWREHAFAAGDFFVLDITGTNRDPRIYERPDTFVAERFLHRDPTAFDLIAQGGGDHELNHRCAGEWVTIAVLVAMLRAHACDMRSRPDPESGIDWSQLPAAPEDGLPAFPTFRH